VNVLGGLPRFAKTTAGISPAIPGISLRYCIPTPVGAWGTTKGAHLFPFILLASRCNLPCPFKLLSLLQTALINCSILRSRRTWYSLVTLSLANSTPDLCRSLSPTYYDLIKTGASHSFRICLISTARPRQHHSASSFQFLFYLYIIAASLRQSINEARPSPQPPRAAGNSPMAHPSRVYAWRWGAFHR
jgi:hypothetical protein